MAAKVKVAGNEKENARMKELEESVGVMEDEYNGVWERVGEIDIETELNEVRDSLSYQQSCNCNKNSNEMG